MAVSTRTDEVMRWIRLYFSSKAIGKGTSASLYGPDLSKWPARAFDAFEVLATHDNLSQLEQQKAARSEL